MPLIVNSTAFTEGTMIPARYTCDGPGLSPPLAWRDAPPDTRAFALISDDPDAPRGIWSHWVLYNLPPEMTALSEGMPDLDTLDNGARQGRNDAHGVGYGPPCPPHGIHRYYFHVYALDAMLSPVTGMTRAALLEAMRDHILAEGQLMGRYARHAR